MSLCKYQNEEIVPKFICRQKVEQDGYCLFHIDKPSLKAISNIPPVEMIKSKQLSDRFYNEILNYMASATDDAYRFIGFVFPYLDWRIPVFNKNVDFRYARFPQGVNFGNDIVFEGDAYFDNAEFNMGFFYSNLFKGSASFSNTIFYGLAGHLNSAIFEKDTNFYKTKFFCNWFSFSGTIFKEKAYFEKVEFRETDERLDALSEYEKNRSPSIIFSHVTFENYSSFSNCDFFINASFNGVKFKNAVDIFRTNFHQESDFTSAEINGESKIWESSFIKTSKFNNVKLSGDISFRGNENRCFKEDVYFQRLKLAKDTTFIFDKVNLSKASFTYTNLENLTFWDVDWFKNSNRKFFIPNRSQLYDEERFNSKDKLYERVADNYRQLVNNYEKKRDFETAEYFHIGEMEIRRKRHKHQSSLKITNKIWRWFRGGFNATGFYWLSSRYGTSYTQGISVLLILTLFIIPVFFLLAGFQTTKEIEPKKNIDFTLIPTSSTELASMSEFVSGYLDAVSYTLSIITFQKDRFFEPIDWLSQIVLYLAMFLLTTQSALTLLAIRRQFKR